MFIKLNRRQKKIKNFIVMGKKPLLKGQLVDILNSAVLLPLLPFLFTFLPILPFSDLLARFDLARNFVTQSL